MDDNKCTAKKTPKPPTQCADCRSVINLERCKCCSNHFLCYICSQKSNVRSDSNNFYKPYRMWCDTCIWFDIS